MCLIVAVVMFVIAIQSFLQHQWTAGTLQLLIALGFTVMLIRNVLSVRDQKRGCTTTGCGTPDWFTALFKKREK